MSERYVAYVGTYTHGSSIGIHICDVNVEEGTLTERKVVPVNNSSYIVQSKNKKFLYSIADEGVAVFRILQDGDLELINKIDINGMRGCYLSVDDHGRYLNVAGYHDGKVTVVHTHRDGHLGNVVAEVFHKGLGSVAERNFRPRVTCTIPTPDDEFLCAVDNGIDQVKIYKFNKAKDKLLLVDILRCDLESGPRELVFDKSGSFAYVICELARKIDVYRYSHDEKNVHFERIQSVSTIIGDADPRHDAAEAITIAPDGRHLFCTTAGINSTTMFDIDPETGLLTPQFCLPTSGAYPKDIMVFPDNKHLAVVNHESNSITTFTIDYENNVLMMKGRPLEIETPNCILITKLEEE